MELLVMVNMTWTIYWVSDWMDLKYNPVEWGMLVEPEWPKRLYSYAECYVRFPIYDTQQRRPLKRRPLNRDLWTYLLWA